jgi:hypothetical protein
MSESRCASQFQGGSDVHIEPHQADRIADTAAYITFAIKTMTSHKSDSTEQQTAEEHLLRAIEKKLGLHFVEGATLGIGVQPDGIDPVNKVVVEAYARVGELKGAQLHKVKADILKLVYIEKKLGASWRKIMCFGSNEAASFLLGTSWAAEAARIFCVEVHVELLSIEQATLVKAAQKRQRMVNAS